MSSFIIACGGTGGHLSPGQHTKALGQIQHLDVRVKEDRKLAQGLSKMGMSDKAVELAESFHQFQSKHFSRSASIVAGGLIRRYCENEVEIDETWIHEIVRRKILHDQQLMTRLCLDQSDAARDLLLVVVKRRLHLRQEVTARQWPCAQRREMCGLLLAIDHGHVFAAQEVHQVGKRDFRCVRQPCKHGFAEHGTPHTDAIQTTHQFVVDPGFYAVGVTRFV